MMKDQPSRLAPEPDPARLLPGVLARLPGDDLAAYGPAHLVDYAISLLAYEAQRLRPPAARFLPPPVDARALRQQPFDYDDLDEEGASWRRRKGGRRYASA